LPVEKEPQQAHRKIKTVALFGEFGPPILTTARSLRDAGIDVVLLGVGSVSPSAWSNAVRFAACIQSADLGTPLGLAILIDFLKQTNAQALLPFWDPQMIWLAANQESLPPGCKLLSTGTEALERVLSKHLQLPIAQRSGFSILPTWELSRHDDVSRIDRSAYPICLRPSAPRDVNPSFKVEVLRSPSALDAFLAHRTWGPEPLLAQPFVSLPSAVIHGVRSESGELLALQAFVAPLKFEGISLTLRPLPLDAHIAECCRKFVDEAGVTGPFHFDLLYSVGNRGFYYLEINVRLGGTTDKVCTLGFDEPLLALSAYGFDVQVRPYCPANGRIAINRKALLKHITSLARGNLSPLDYPFSSPVRHLLLSLGSFLWGRDSIASLRDLRGTWFFYLGARAPVFRRTLQPAPSTPPTQAG